MPPLSFSWELDGPIASLLGTGVALLMLGFLNAGVLTGTVGFAITLLLEEVPLVLRIPFDELGVLAEGVFLVKKLAIDCCRVADPVLELSFFREGGGLAGVAWEEEVLAIVTMANKGLISPRWRKEYTNVSCPVIGVNWGVKRCWNGTILQVWKWWKSWKSFK